jgi:hypothetical protein
MVDSKVYFLDNLKTKFICVGIELFNDEPTIELHSTDTLHHIEFSCWTEFSSLLPVIQKFFAGKLDFQIVLKNKALDDIRLSSKTRNAYRLLSISQGGDGLQTEVFLNEDQIEKLSRIHSIIETRRLEAAERAVVVHKMAKKILSKTTRAALSDSYSDFCTALNAIDLYSLDNGTPGCGDYLPFVILEEITRLNPRDLYDMVD